MKLLRYFLDWLSLNHHFYHQGPEKIRKRQEKRIFSLLEFVQLNSPFYRELHGEHRVLTLQDFKKLPVINKSILMTNFDELNTAGLQLSDVMSFALEKEKSQNYLGYYQNQYVVGLSSGTSGNKGIYVTPRTLTERLPGVFLARGGIFLKDLPARILFVLRVFSQGFADINAPMIQLKYCASMTKPLQIIESLNQMKANILMAPPSVLRQVLPFRSHLKQNLKRIITYAEVLTPTEKARFAAGFNTHVVEIYQASEGQIASPCRYGNLHINEDLVYVELLDDQGNEIGPGQRSRRMILTNLVNTIQPLIRYEMNDMIELGDRCPCGSHFRVIRQVIGRHDDVLYFNTSHGEIRPVYPDLFSRWIITCDDRIREFLIEQDGPNHLIIRLDLGQTESAAEESTAGERMNETDSDLIVRLKEQLTLELAGFDIQCTFTIKIETIHLPTDNSKLKRFSSIYHERSYSQ